MMRTINVLMHCGSIQSTTSQCVSELITKLQNTGAVENAKGLFTMFVIIGLIPIREYFVKHILKT